MQPGQPIVRQSLVDELSNAIRLAESNIRNGVVNKPNSNSWKRTDTPISVLDPPLD